MQPKRRVLPPVWLISSMLVAAALHFVLPLVQFESMLVRVGGAVLLLFGMFMTASSAGAFKRAGTPVVPFETSTALVTTGWFRFTRNPMYLGMVIMLIGTGLALGSIGALLPLPVFVAIIQTRFIRGEEQMLTEIFGQQFIDYRARVRRWL